MVTGKNNCASYLCTHLLFLALSVETSHAFVAPGNKQQWRQPQPWAVGPAVGPSSWSLQPLALFGRGKSDKEDSNDPAEQGKDETNEKRPFFARFGRTEQAEVEVPAPVEPEETETPASDPPAVAVVATATQEPPAEVPAPAMEEETPVSDPPAVAVVATATQEPPAEVSAPAKEEETPASDPTAVAVVAAVSQAPPVEATSPSKEESATPVLSPAAARAAALRAQSEKLKLEAARMDAELTLQKIAKLERELASAKAKGTKEGGSSVEDLQRSMEILVKKMNGDDSPTAPVATTVSKPAVQTVIAAGAVGEKGQFGNAKMAKLMEPFSEKEFQETKEAIEKSPAFLIKTLATQVGMDYTVAADVNTTDLALRLDKMNRLDFSYTDLPRPTFSKKEIDLKMELLKDLKSYGVADQRLLDASKGNDTELALLLLEQQYYSGQNAFDWSDADIVKIFQGEEWLKPVADLLNKTDVDQTIETLYPQCMRKEGQNPTLAQVQQLVADVLPKASFQLSSKPEPVAGGYIIRGLNKAADGNALIEAIDTQLAKSSLGDKMTVLYANDFTIFVNENADEIDLLDDLASILYVTGPDIVRPPRRILLSAVSALGIATSWYLSIYPFLLNPALSQRVEQDLALVDANMSPDLSWLTDLSIPLFYTFFGIQLLHDIAHTVVAKSYGIETRAPTFVPSLITGITSSVTTFKTPPKNNEAMFDYAVSGPLCGMLASIAAIFVGSQLTMTGDPSLFPCLPIEILRQSTMGGGIIESILGNGVLSVPEAALGTQAVAGMTIPLHPVVVAGYISLIVNALSVLPIGTTDGGRMGLSLFGRGAKLLIGNVSLAALLFVGLGGSDLFLFYFAFCLACQAGNEIPARNEVDKVGFSRVGVATFAYALALLSLIPFQ